MHYNIGKNIIKNGRTLPENLPPPEKSLKELEKENMNLIRKLKSKNVTKIFKI